nr:MAG TPA: cell division protein kinase [Caudoviricetes sp.]
MLRGERFHKNYSPTVHHCSPLKLNKESKR